MPTVVLGIETSCDETAAAVVEDGVRVRSNIIATQHDLHARYAGVVPEIASRAHLERILPVVREALATAGATLGDLDAVAVGHRPGLIGSLLVGVSAAKALAWSLGVPIVGVDHVVAHLHAAFLRDDEGGAEAARRDAAPNATRRTDVATPAREASPGAALGLVVSGGHTNMYLVDEAGRAAPLARTIDDAVGEAYDKVGTLLGLPYPGGPHVDRLAASGDERAFDFPTGLPRRDVLDFSFSGLKTAVLYEVRPPSRRGGDRTGLAAPGAQPSERAGPPQLTERRRADIAASFQRAAIGAIVRKIGLALDRHPVATLLVGGGVSANSRLRRELAELAAERGV
ncbi:MAG: tRNA (adenosine(37)-N6)-threonylcarbamoyltransferase complex transferase subunit TsaD, partial [Phycisphaerales bacterium]